MQSEKQSMICLQQFILKEQHHIMLIVFWAHNLSLTEFRLATENQNTPDIDQICRKILCSINVVFYFFVFIVSIEAKMLRPIRAALSLNISI